MTIALAANLMTSILCAAVLVQSVRMARRLNTVKDGDLPRMVAALDNATGEARAVLSELKRTLGTDCAQHARQVEHARELRDELEIISGIGNAAAERILAAMGQANGTEPAAETVEAPDEALNEAPDAAPEAASGEARHQTAAEAPAEASEEASSETAAEAPDETPAEALGKTSAKTPAKKTPAKTPAKTSAKTSAKTPAEAPDDISADTPDEVGGDVVAINSAAATPEQGAPVIAAKAA